MQRDRLSRYVSLVVCMAAAQAAWGSPASDPSDFSAPERYFQVLRDGDDKPQYLETAVASFVSPNSQPPITVDLVGAIHVGDEEYFRTLNRLLKEYDVVLYEMVKPKPGERGADRPTEPHALAKVQRVMPSTLGFAFQVDEIDYDAENFVHADMSPAEMGEAMRSRGDTSFSLFMKIVQEVLQQYGSQWSAGDSAQSGGDLTTLLPLLTQKESIIELKRLIADKLDSLGPNLGLGTTLDTMLVADRNEAAMKVLRQELARDEGKPRRIAIFYGAAHMPDFAKRLTAELGMQPKSVSWVRAWDIEKQPRASALEGLLQLLGT